MKKALLSFCAILISVSAAFAQSEAVHEGQAAAPQPSAAPAARDAGAILPSASNTSNAPAVTVSPDSVVATSMNYVLRAGDLLRIEIFNEPNLTKEVRIAGDGTLILPLVGSVKIAGYTVGDATALLREMFGRDYLVNPGITLLIVQYASRLVYVHGQTMRGSTPVQMPPEGEFYLTQAISAAGGINLRADSNVVIKRKKPEGGYEIINANIKRIYRNANSEDIPLRENDVIFVDESVF